MTLAVNEDVYDKNQEIRIPNLPCYNHNRNVSDLFSKWKIFFPRLPKFSRRCNFYNQTPRYYSFDKNLDEIRFIKRPTPKNKSIFSHLRSREIPPEGRYADLISKIQGQQSAFPISCVIWKTCLVIIYLYMNFVCIWFFPK